MTLHAFMDATGHAFFATCAMNLVGAVMGLPQFSPEVWERWRSVFVPFFSLYAFLTAVDQLQQGNVFYAGFVTVCGVFVFYQWWNNDNNRRRRKRLRDRAARRIAAIGGRLRVLSPVPS